MKQRELEETVGLQRGWAWTSDREAGRQERRVYNQNGCIETDAAPNLRKTAGQRMKRHRREQKRRETESEQAREQARALEEGGKERNKESRAREARVKSKRETKKDSTNRAAREETKNNVY